MVSSLRQSGDGDSAYQSRLQCANRKAAAMAGIVAYNEAGLLQKGRVFCLHFQADRVRAAMKTNRHIALAANPLHMVGASARQRRVEERLPEASYIYHDSQPAADCKLTEARAQTPC